MKNFKLYLLSFALFAGFLTSCSNTDSVVEEQNIDETEAITQSLNRLAQQFNDDGYVITSANPSGNIVFDFCFDFVYPLNLAYNNGTTVSVSSLDDLITILINSNDNLYINGVEFPFDVETYNGSGAIEIITINNESEFFDLLEDCDFDAVDECECFEVYEPVCVEVQSPSGESFTITYPNECYAICDGFTPNDFVENCANDGNNTGGFECFDFNFPLTIITDDQQTITVNSQEELDNALYNTYYFDFVYPFEVTNPVEVISIENENDFIDLLEDCYDYNECPCTTEVNPVCVEVQTGSGTEIITFPNACEAECDGFTAADFVNCDINPSDCSEQEVFDYLIQCDWYINTSLYNTVNAEYIQFSQNGTLEIISQGSTSGISGTWDLNSNPSQGDVFMFLNVTSAPYDMFYQIDWTVTTCSENFIVLESGDEFIQLERECNNNQSGCTPNYISGFLTECSWSVGNYTYVFNNDGNVIITDEATTIAGLWFIGNTGGGGSPTSILIQGDQNLNEEWFFTGCEDDNVIVTSSTNPSTPIIYDCN